MKIQKKNWGGGVRGVGVGLGGQDGCERRIEVRVRGGGRVGVVRVDGKIKKK